MTALGSEAVFPCSPMRDFSWVDEAVRPANRSAVSSISFWRVMPGQKPLRLGEGLLEDRPPARPPQVFQLEPVNLPDVLVQFRVDVDAPHVGGDQQRRVLQRMA